MTLLVYARRFVSLVKFEHSIFALPFAYAAAFLAEMRGARLLADVLDHRRHGGRPQLRHGASTG